MGAVEIQAMKADANAKNRDRINRRRELREINSALRREAMSGDKVQYDTPEAARAHAKAAVEKAAAAKRDKAEKLRSARCAVFQQRKDSRRMKQEPPEED